LRVFFFEQRATFFKNLVFSIEIKNMIEMKHIRLIAFLTLVLTLCSCERGLWDSGDLIIEDRPNAEYYTGIDVDGNLDVYISSGNDYDIRVESGERKIKHIITEVIDEVLFIYEKNNSVASDKQSKVFLNQEFLDKIFLDGSGDVFAPHLESSNMDIALRGSGDIDLNFVEISSVKAQIRGSGDIHLNGEGSSLDLDIDGSGDIDAKDLEVQVGDVRIDGSGDVWVNASDELNVLINGSGDVTYFGNPNLNVEINGSGDVEPF